MIGFASIGGLVAMIAAVILSLSVLGMGLPDEVAGLPFVAMLGGCVGWVTGAAVGFRAGRDARPAGSAGGVLLLLGGAIVALGALVIIVSPIPTRLSGGVTYFSFWREAAGPEFEVTMIVGTVVVLATFLTVWRRREAPPSRPLGRTIGGIGLAGLVVGVASLSLAMLFVKENWASVAYYQRYRAVSGTLGSLLTAAEQQQERSGSYPTSLDEVLASGGTIRRGTQVEFAGVVNGSFCVRVGVDVGEDDRAGDPHYSGLVHPRPPRTNSWTSEETWLGNSCSSSH